MVKTGIALLLLNCAITAAAANQTVVSNARRGLPGRRISGGTRSECMAGSPPIVALTPEDIGETASTAPAVHFFVPELDVDYPLEFSLRDANGERIYDKSLSTQESAGIVGIQLPPETLSANQNYRWYLSVICDAFDPFQNDVLSGDLRQVDTDATAFSGVDFSNTEEGLSLARSYQAAELWTDAVDVAVNLHEQYPDDENVMSLWQDFLQVLEIENAVQGPMEPR